MAWTNSAHQFGGWSQLFHWLIVALFALQFVSGPVMLNVGSGETLAGLTQGDLYNWHKSLGLVALMVAVFRLINRKVQTMPNWAPGLTSLEKAFLKRAEPALYTGMFVMPISGFVFVMAGGYGVKFFGIWSLPNPFGGKIPALAIIAEYVHLIAAILVGLLIISHVSLVMRHHFLLKNGMLYRMLPLRRRG